MLLFWYQPPSCPIHPCFPNNMSHEFHSLLTEIRQDTTYWLTMMTTLDTMTHILSRTNTRTALLDSPSEAYQISKAIHSVCSIANITRVLITLTLSVSIFPLLHVTLLHIHLSIFYTSHLWPEWNTLHNKPSQQPATAVNMKAHHSKQFRVSSIQTHMHFPQDYCIVNGTTMISAWVNVILLPSRYAIMLAWRHESKSV